MTAVPPTPAAPSDYTSVQATFTFSRTVRRLCVNVTTVDDTNNLEEVEVFSLRLSSTDGSVVLNPGTATVNITDDEGQCYISVSTFIWCTHIVCSSC